MKMAQTKPARAKSFSFSFISLTSGNFMKPSEIKWIKHQQQSIGLWNLSFFLSPFFFQVFEIIFYDFAMAKGVLSSCYTLMHLVFIWMISSNTSKTKGRLKEREREGKPFPFTNIWFNQLRVLFV
jgi:hypothetical protein